MNYKKYIIKLLLLIFIYFINNIVLKTSLELVDVIKIFTLNIFNFILIITGILCIINIIINIISDGIALNKRNNII